MKNDPSVIRGFEIPETGVLEIDRQHAELIENLESLTLKIGIPTEIADTLGAISRLNKDVDEHFQFEEEFLRANGYPQLAGHAREHDAMREKIADLTGEILDGREITMEIIDMIREWMLTHVNNEDVEYAKFLNDGARFDFPPHTDTIPAL